DTFSLTTAPLNKAVLLSEKTTVVLRDVALSDRVFSVLLSKTKVSVGECFSIFGDNEDEDCIREHCIERNTPFFLRRIGEDEKPLVSFLEKIPPNSINCTLKKITLKKTVLINILPKLSIRKDCEVELVLLDADKREQVAAILDT
ncbi:MAG: uncharacterized protein A8A55_3590, partial [Amphiamblys sp. WSBS2006]